MYFTYLYLTFIITENENNVSKSIIFILFSCRKTLSINLDILPYPIDRGDGDILNIFKTSFVFINTIN